ncbi:hypothetical protein DPMN_131774 [Dreissena polymorpha]|uniref:Uncharacterized protein n=1 Tax=Dreissena polymorpha TaxID=45954 RepID=A0A9D4JD47_DREPO|nr:hypothetical protein DPMN_131774 [Dreissena polymorpha]
MRFNTCPYSSRAVKEDLYTCDSTRVLFFKGCDSGSMYMWFNTGPYSSRAVNEDLFTSGSSRVLLLQGQRQRIYIHVVQHGP